MIGDNNFVTRATVWEAATAELIRLTEQLEDRQAELRDAQASVDRLRSAVLEARVAEEQAWTELFKSRTAES